MEAEFIDDFKFSVSADVADESFVVDDLNIIVFRTQNSFDIVVFCLSVIDDVDA